MTAPEDGNDVLAAGGVLSLDDTEPIALPPEKLLAGPITVNLADVKPERVSWLWPGRIPLGKLSLIDGDPGLGKSTLTLDLAARVTTGRPFPDGSPCERGAVVCLSGEDGLGDTIRPRLDAAGGDPARVAAITGKRLTDGTEAGFSLLDLAELESAIRATGARTGFAVRLVVVDPVAAFYGPDVNSHKDQDVRRLLAPLAGLADRLGVAVVLVRHMNKASGGPAIYRGGGSIGLAGAARSVLLVGKHPDDEDRRLFAAIKSNLAPPADTLAFGIEGTATGSSRLVWETGSVKITAAEILAAGAGGDGERESRADAKSFLREALASGSEAAADVIKAGRQHGFNERTLQRALRDLGGETRKAAFGGGWRWSLSQGDTEGDEGDTVSTPVALSPSCRLREPEPEAAPPGELGNKGSRSPAPSSPRCSPSSSPSPPTTAAASSTAAPRRPRPEQTDIPFEGDA